MVGISASRKRARAGRGPGAARSMIASVRSTAPACSTTRLPVGGVRRAGLPLDQRHAEVFPRACAAVPTEPADVRREAARPKRRSSASATR